MGRTSTLPKRLQPMLATLTDKPFDDDEWLFEDKYDGFRMVANIEGGKVTLMGQVTRPTLQSSAGNVVKRIEGVTQVVNNIEVLPLSPFDDGIRLRVARAIYGYGALSRYGLGSQPSIRIIVKNGEVTLEGVVLNQGDRNIANIRANGVFGVFKVNNNLRTERS